MDFKSSIKPFLEYVVNSGLTVDQLLNNINITSNLVPLEEEIDFIKACETYYNNPKDLKNFCTYITKKGKNICSKETVNEDDVCNKHKKSKNHFLSRYNEFVDDMKKESSDDESCCSDKVSVKSDASSSKTHSSQEKKVSVKSDASQEKKVSVKSDASSSKTHSSQEKKVSVKSDASSEKKVSVKSDASSEKKMSVQSSPISEISSDSENEEISNRISLKDIDELENETLRKYFKTKEAKTFFNYSDDLIVILSKDKNNNDCLYYICDTKQIRPVSISFAKINKNPNKYDDYETDKIIDFAKKFLDVSKIVISSDFNTIDV